MNSPPPGGSTDYPLGPLSSAIARDGGRPLTMNPRGLGAVMLQHNDDAMPIDMYRNDGRAQSAVQWLRTHAKAVAWATLVAVIAVVALRSATAPPEKQVSSAAGDSAVVFEADPNLAAPATKRVDVVAGKPAAARAVPKKAANAHNARGGGSAGLGTNGTGGVQDHEQQTRAPSPSYSSPAATVRYRTMPPPPQPAPPQPAQAGSTGSSGSGETISGGSGGGDELVPIQ